MLPLTLILTLFLISSFEGEIVYVNTYTPSDPEAPVNPSWTELGDTTRFLIKHGRYKMTFNGKKQSTAIYFGEKNLWYFFTNINDTILAMPADIIARDSYTFDTPQNSDEVLLGLKCKSVVANSRLGRTTYYYNEEIGIDPSGFLGHNLDGWYHYCTLTRSLPLLVKYEFKGYTQIQRAIALHPRKVDDSEFEIASGRPVLHAK